MDKVVWLAAIFALGVLLAFGCATDADMFVSEYHVVDIESRCPGRTACVVRTGLHSCVLWVKADGPNPHDYNDAVIECARLSTGLK